MERQDKLYIPIFHLWDEIKTREEAITQGKSTSYYQYKKIEERAKQEVVNEFKEKIPFEILTSQIEKYFETYNVSPILHWNKKIEVVSLGSWKRGKEVFTKYYLEEKPLNLSQMVLHYRVGHSCLSKDNNFVTFALYSHLNPFLIRGEEYVPAWQLNPDYINIADFVNYIGEKGVLNIFNEFSKLDKYGFTVFDKSIEDIFTYISKESTPRVFLEEYSREVKLRKFGRWSSFHNSDTFLKLLCYLSNQRDAYEPFEKSLNNTKLEKMKLKQRLNFN